jgi:glycosyltransferase involved in cell wall biosynthesis
MISIIIPMYNRATLVGETLDSILDQTYTDWECIVIDDGSSDNSVDVVQKYVDKDSRFKLLIRPKDRIKGGPTCRNIGYENSKGEIIYWFDSDDLLHPQAFSAIIEMAEENPTVEYFLVQDVMFAQKINLKEIIPRIKNFAITPFKYFIRYPYMALTRKLVWRRSFLEFCRIQWEEGRIGFQDRDFYFRLLMISHTEGMWIPQYPLAFCRRHTKQLDKSKDSSSKEKATVILQSMINLYYVLITCPGISEKEKEMYLDGICEYSFRIATYFDTRYAAKEFYDSICKIPKVKPRHKWKAYLLWKFSGTVYFFLAPLREYCRLLPFFNKKKF